MLGPTGCSILVSFNELDDLSALRLLIFRVGDLICAAEVTAVREILPDLQATRIPGAPEAVRGLVNVRGELLTLVDAGTLFARGARGTDGPTLVITVEERTVAFAVDEVLDLVSLDADELSPREELPGVDARLVRAVGRRAGSSFVVLDLDAVLGPILTS